MFSGCKKDEVDNGNPNNNTGGTETGLYMGIIGFNEKCEPKDIELLNSYTKNGFHGFVEDLTSKNGTVLYHAVNTAIDKLNASQFPEDLTNVSIVTFTDGLDIGSYMLNENFRTSGGDAYLSSVKNRITSEKIKGNNISAFSIGIKGNDVQDAIKFDNDLLALASKPENKFNVTSMEEVNSKFQEIAASLYKENSMQNISLSVSTPNPNMKIRLTFDNSPDDGSSALYIEGTLTPPTLSNVTYHGCTSSSGSTITGTISGIWTNFTFLNLKTNTGEVIPANHVKQYYTSSTSTEWQINGEFANNANIQTEVERKSAVIMLVLDCSSSLGNDFTKMQNAAKNFIDILLAGNNNGGGNNGGGNSSSNYVILTENNLMVQTYNIGHGYCGSVSELCEVSTEGGYTDWRLPTIDELNILYGKRIEIGGFTGNEDSFSGDCSDNAYPCAYWSSTQTYDDWYNNSIYKDFCTGEVSSYNGAGSCSYNCKGRCVRSF